MLRRIVQLTCLALALCVAGGLPQGAFAQSSESAAARSRLKLPVSKPFIIGL